MSPWLIPLPLAEYALSRVGVYFYIGSWLPIKYCNLDTAVALSRKALRSGIEIFVFPAELDPCNADLLTDSGGEIAKARAKLAKAGSKFTKAHANFASVMTKFVEQLDERPLEIMPYPNRHPATLKLFPANKIFDQETQAIDGFMEEIEQLKAQVFQLLLERDQLAEEVNMVHANSANLNLDKANLKDAMQQLKADQMKAIALLRNAITPKNKGGSYAANNATQLKRLVEQALELLSRTFTT